MGARAKLNSAHLNQAFWLAGGAGIMTGSWTVFLITWATLVALATSSGDIRPDRRRPRGR